MNPIVLETNVVISFLTDRNPRQQQIAARFFEDTAALKQEMILQGFRRQLKRLGVRPHPAID